MAKVLNPLLEMENIVVIQFGSGGEIGNKGRNQDGNSVASKYKD